MQYRIKKIVRIDKATNLIDFFLRGKYIEYANCMFLVNDNVYKLAISGLKQVRVAILLGYPLQRLQLLNDFNV